MESAEMIISKHQKNYTAACYITIPGISLYSDAIRGGRGCAAEARRATTSGDVRGGDVLFAFAEFLLVTWCVINTFEIGKLRCEIALAHSEQLHRTLHQALVVLETAIS
ncbi:unnamed protein product [Arctia plantaginis]|uniref:Uncharacterized protein n=1 Tax=Arctia plantaginis TaxID=874455 RepID=A0A8S0ZG00_ARCPL|nr:unnamed protein product [Arctia plantaginis]